MSNLVARQAKFATVADVYRHSLLGLRPRRVSCRPDQPRSRKATIRTVFSAPLPTSEGFRGFPAVRAKPSQVEMFPFFQSLISYFPRVPRVPRVFYIYRTFSTSSPNPIFLRIRARKPSEPSEAGANRLPARRFSTSRVCGKPSETLGNPRQSRQKKRVPGRDGSANPTIGACVAHCQPSARDFLSHSAAGAARQIRRSRTGRHLERLISAASTTTSM